jgi:hypothetical protein
MRKNAQALEPERFARLYKQGGSEIEDQMRKNLVKHELKK